MFLKSHLSIFFALLVAIRFYAQGCFQHSVSNQQQFNISQPSTSRCLHAVTEAINRRLLRRWLKFPMTAIDRQQTTEMFATAPQPFEGAIGAIDCTFVHILWLLTPLTHFPEDTQQDQYTQQLCKARCIVERCF